MVWYGVNSHLKSHLLAYPQRTGIRDDSSYVINKLVHDGEEAQEIAVAVVKNGSWGCGREQAHLDTTYVTDLLMRSSSNLIKETLQMLNIQ